MHQITIAKPIELGKTTGVLEQGRYLIDDINAGKLLLSYRDHVSLDSVCLPIKKYGPVPSILLVGGLAFGDQLLFMPVVQQLKKNGFERISVSLFNGFAGVFDEFEYAPNPVPMDIVGQYDFVVSLERAFEDRDRHITDVFAEIVGVELSEKTYRYSVNEIESQWAKDTYPLGAKKRIGIQVNASSPARTYPRTNELVDKLLKDGWQVMLFGSPGEIKSPDKNVDVINLSQDGLDFRHSVAVLNTCDAFIGPDSALIHYAGSLGKPSVGLYGAFSWRVRTSYWPSVFSIQGSKDCDLAPCHHHSWVSPFPADGPCRRKGYCLPLASIEPERIVAKLKQII